MKTALTATANESSNAAMQSSPTVTLKSQEPLMNVNKSSK
jgi:hypothetical protein